MHKIFSRASTWHRGVIVLLVFLTFGSVLGQTEFLADDWGFYHFATATGWKAIFKANVASYHYLPVYTAYLKAMYFLLGGNAPAFGFMNLVLQALNACLIYSLARRFRISPLLCFFIAVLYGTYYLDYEAVFWVIGGCTLLMITFYLLTLHSYIWATDRSASFCRMAVPWTFGFLCLFTIESGITVFPVCFALDAYRQWVRAGRSYRTLLTDKGAGILLRSAGPLLIVLIMLLIKQRYGGRITVAEKSNLAALPAIIADYFLRFWAGSEELICKLSRYDGRSELWLSLYHHTPVRLYAYFSLAAVVPALLIFWRGNSRLKFFFLWLALVISAMSFGAGQVFSRYFPIVSMPGCFVVVLLLYALSRWVTSMLGGSGVRLALASCLVASVVLYGIVHNRKMGRDFYQASQITRNVLYSPALIEALETRNQRNIIVLNVPIQYREKTLLGNAYIFLNGFTDAVFLRHKYHYHFQKANILPMRLKGYDLSRNVLPQNPILETGDMEKILGSQSAIILKYDEATQGLTRLQTADGAQSSSSAR